MRRWRVGDKRRCFFANLGSEIKELNDLQRHRSWRRSFTGSLQRISATRSNGSVGNCVAWNDDNVRVSVEVVVNRCLLAAVVWSSLLEVEVILSGAPGRWFTLRSMVQVFFNTSFVSRDEAIYFWFNSSLNSSYVLRSCEFGALKKTTKLKNYNEAIHYYFFN